MHNEATTDSPITTQPSTYKTSVGTTSSFTASTPEDNVDVSTVASSQHVTTQDTNIERTTDSHTTLQPSTYKTSVGATSSFTASTPEDNVDLSTVASSQHVTTPDTYITSATMPPSGSQEESTVFQSTRFSARTTGPEEAATELQSIGLYTETVNSSQTSAFYSSVATLALSEGSLMSTTPNSETTMSSKTSFEPSPATSGVQPTTSHTFTTHPLSGQDLNHSIAGPCDIEYNGVAWIMKSPLINKSSQSTEHSPLAFQVE